MDAMLAEIRDGRFARELAAEMEAGAPTLAGGRKRAEAHHRHEQECPYDLVNTAAEVE